MVHTLPLPPRLAHRAITDELLTGLWMMVQVRSWGLTAEQHQPEGFQTSKRARSTQGCLLWQTEAAVPGERWLCLNSA